MNYLVVVGTALTALLLGPAAFGQTEMSLGTITLSRAVMADGQRLPAGSYQVRLTADQPEPAAGQTPGAARYVQFLRGGKVVGRELATVITAEDADEVFQSPRPGPGSHRIDTLVGAEYVRVWINRGGTHYILHLPPATSS